MELSTVTPASDTVSLIAHLQGELDDSTAKLDDLARERARLTLKAARGDTDASEQLRELGAESWGLERHVDDLNRAIPLARIERNEEAIRAAAEQRARDWATFSANCAAIGEGSLTLEAKLKEFAQLWGDLERMRRIVHLQFSRLVPAQAANFDPGNIGSAIVARLIKFAGLEFHQLNLNELGWESEILRSEPLEARIHYDVERMMQHRPEEINSAKVTTNANSERSDDDAHSPMPEGPKRARGRPFQKGQTGNPNGRPRKAKPAEPQA